MNFTFHTATTARGADIHVGITSTIQRADGSTCTTQELACGASHRYVPRFSAELDIATIAERVTCERCIPRVERMLARATAVAQ